MKHSRLLSVLLLLAVLAVCFLVRAESGSLPSVAEENREYFLDESGQPYLTDMDSYYYARLAREISETGKPFLFSRRWTDPLMYQRPTEDAAEGQGDPMLLPILAYLAWRVLSLFGKTDIITVARWMGPVVGSLAAIPVFCYLRRRTNLAGAFTGALLAGAAIPFVAHTHMGFFDTDMLLGVLPLGFILLELYAMQAARLRSQLAAGICSGILLGLVSLTWYAYFTYFWLMALGGLAGMILILLCPMRIPFCRRLQAGRGWLISVLCALAMVFVCRGNAGVDGLGQLFTAFRNVGGSSNSFPFVHQYTGEMQALPFLPEDRSALSLLSGNLYSAVGCMGGILPCLLIAAAVPLGLFRTLRRKEHPEAPQRHDAMIALLTEIGMLVLWLAFGVKLTETRRRFAEITALPGAVMAGLGAGFAAGLLKNRRFPWRAAAGIALSAAVCLPMALGARTVARGEIPDVTDSVNDAAQYLAENTPEDTAVTGWWDYGYFTQFAARRRAVADGGTTSSAVNYFMAKALLTDNPAEMAGIFRMLEVCGSAAVYRLAGTGAGQPAAADALLRMAATDREGAAEILNALPMAEEDRTALLEMTHPAEEKPLVLMLTGDLLVKLDALSYFGLWDMETRTAGESVYWTHGDASRELSPGGETVWPMVDPEIVLTARMDEAGQVEAEMSKGGRPYSLSRLCVWQDGVMTQDTALPGSGPAVILTGENGRYTVVPCSPNLCGSMLFRLYVCGDRTMKGAKLLGTWYDKPTGDPLPAQQRVTMTGPLTWPVQIWEISEDPEVWKEENGGSGT